MLSEIKQNGALNKMSTRRYFLKLVGMLVPGMAFFVKGADAQALVVQKTSSAESAFLKPNAFVETPRDLGLEEFIQKVENELECLPIDTPRFNDDYYSGTIPPTLFAFVSAPVFGNPPWDRSWCSRYRVFKNKNGNFTLQEIRTCSITHANVATGDWDYIVEKHKLYTNGIPPYII